MSKYCGNCGAMANDSDRVCGNCGAPFADAPAPNYNNNAGYNNVNFGAPAADPLAGGAKQSALKKIDFKNLKGSFQSMDKKQRLITCGIGVVAILLVLIIVCSIVGNAGGKGAMKKYMKYKTKDKPEKLAAVLYVREDRDEESVAKGLVYDPDDYDKISYDIIDKQKLKKKEVSSLKDRLESEGFDKAEKVKKAVLYAVKVTAKDGSRKYTSYYNYIVVKVGGKWKVVTGSVSAFDYSGSGSDDMISW